MLLESSETDIISYNLMISLPIRCLSPCVSFIVINYSRYGRELTSLSPIVTHLPLVFLDSEVWFGRGQFALTQGVTNADSEVQWDLLRMMSFDTPSREFEIEEFEIRYSLLFTAIPTEHPFLNVVPRVLCINDAHIADFVNCAISNEGEGVIVQRYGAAYERGRTSSLVKLKSTEDDKEAIVVSTGDDNSVSLKLPTGTTFSVSSSQIHVSTLKVGDVVTFSYDSNSRHDIPMDPKIYRIRTDLLWDDVVQQYNKEYHLQKRTENTSSKRIGYWTPKTMRVYMENFAKSRNMDPLLPETWYSSFKGFCHSKNGRTILGKFKNGYYQALKDLFPEVKFNSNEFVQSVWTKVENRRRFFENFATRNGFDPLIAKNWYLQSKSEIMSHKGAQAIILHHLNSLATALLDLFPNIGLSEPKLRAHLKIWGAEKRKHFFIKYAANNGFDPLDPDQWYLQKRDDILATIGAKRVIIRHNNSISTALLDLFPDIGLERSKLQALADWHISEKSRRRFFEIFAKDNGFDPLIPENWYFQSLTSIMATKGATKVVLHYANSVVAALIDLFPSIGLSKVKLRKNLSPWSDPGRRRKFFESYAQENGFDPLIPERWYAQPKDKIMSLKRIRGVLFHHAGSIAKALVDLFPNIGLKLAKFRIPRIAPWSNVDRQRQFFVDYAKQHNFDPLNPNNWYAQSKRYILSKPGAPRIALYHGKRVSEALVALFPDIGLDKEKLQARKGKKIRI